MRSPGPRMRRVFLYLTHSIDAVAKRWPNLFDGSEADLKVTLHICLRSRSHRCLPPLKRSNLCIGRLSLGDRVEIEQQFADKLDKRTLSDILASNLPRHEAVNVLVALTCSITEPKAPQGPGGISAPLSLRVPNSLIFAQLHSHPVHLFSCLADTANCKLCFKISCCLSQL